MGTVDLGVDSNMADNLTVEQESEVKEAFGLADKNSSGSIMVKEVGMVVRALGMNPSDEELQEMIEGRGDGTNISFQEFLGIVGNRMNEVDNEDELREAFAVFDRDGQGFIRAAELRHMMTNLGEKLSDQEVDDMIREAGIDNDGQFRYQDFVDRMVSGN